MLFADVSCPATLKANKFPINSLSLSLDGYDFPSTSFYLLMSCPIKSVVKVFESPDSIAVARPESFLPSAGARGRMRQVFPETRTWALQTCE
jgi:hypothetical protein